MTNDNSNIFGDLNEPAESTACPGETPCVLAISAPAKNSIELEIRAMAATDPFMQIDCAFTEIEDADVPVEVTIDAEMDDARSDLARCYAFHVAASRSLGPNATLEKYNDLCIAEGMVPLKIR